MLLFDAQSITVWNYINITWEGLNIHSKSEFWSNFICSPWILVKFVSIFGEHTALQDLIQQESIVVTSCQSLIYLLSFVELIVVNFSFLFFFVFIRCRFYLLLFFVTSRHSSPIVVIRRYSIEFCFFYSKCSKYFSPNL